jgi:hypothetical protein
MRMSLIVRVESIGGFGLEAAARSEGLRDSLLVANVHFLSVAGG